MANTQLVDIIRAQEAKGLNREIIESSLLSMGKWSQTDIDLAFGELGGTPAPQVVPVNVVKPVATVVAPVSTPVAMPVVAPVVAPVIQPTPVQAPATPVAQVSSSVKYAGFWIRYVAWSVDLVILLIPLTLMNLVFGSAFLTDGAGTQIISSFLPTIFVWIYFILMTNFAGATLGKMLVGITVKSEDMGKLSLGNIILRETVGKFVSGLVLLVGYIMAAFTERKQSLHDKFAHSVVVYKDPSQKHTGRIILGIFFTLLPFFALIAIMFVGMLAVWGLSSAGGKSLINSIKSTDSSVTQNIDSTSNADTTSNRLFAFDLPKNWQYATSTSDGTLAYDLKDKRILTMSTRTSASLTPTTSVFDVFSADELKAGLARNIPTAEVKTVTKTSFAGEEAYVTNYTFTRSLTSDTNSTQTPPFYVIEYDLVHNKVFYSLGFVSASNTSADTADASAIAKSFTFNN